jgi:hypothetical protein
MLLTGYVGKCRGTCIICGVCATGGYGCWQQECNKVLPVCGDCSIWQTVGRCGEHTMRDCSGYRKCGLRIVCWE